MKKRIIKIILIIAISIIGLITYYYLNQNYNFSIPCLFHKITGYYCPGCGITRCLFSLLQGKIYQAFMYNQLVFILLPFIILYFIYTTYIYIFNKKNTLINKIPNYIYIILLIIVISYGIIRNLDFFPYLRP